MLAFIRLQMKLRWGRDRGADKRNALLTGVIGVLVILVLLALVYMFTAVLLRNVPAATAENCAAFYITVIEICLTAAGVSMQLKWLFRPADLKITARFPLSPFKMYVANVLLVFINLYIFSALIFLPVMAVFALAAGMTDLSVFGGIVLGAVFSPLVPFVLSSLISVPVLFVMSFLQNRNVVKVVLFVAVLAAGFALYDYVLTLLSDYFINQSMSANTSGIWGSILSALDTPLNLSAWLRDTVFFENAGRAAGIQLAVFAAGSALALALAKPVYDFVRRRAPEGETGAFRRRSRCTERGVSAAMFAHEFKEILRTRTYAYFYLGIAIATPVMVFFCNRLAADAGAAQVGEGFINFGASVLVISVFMAMISSFSAASISREGHRFFITKIIPVPPRRQLAVKGLLIWLVSAGALAISLVIVASLHFLTLPQTLFAAAFGLVLAGGFVLDGLNRNLKRPNVRPRADGEINEINITVTMLLGILISAAAGLAAIILPSLIGTGAVCIALLSAAAIYMLVHLTVFLRTAAKRYESIEA